MRNKAPIIVILLAAFICGFGTEPHNGLAGKFLLYSRPVGSDEPDSIEFRPDGSCILEANGTTNITGKYATDGEGKLSIQAEALFRAAYQFKYQLQSVR